MRRLMLLAIIPVIFLVGCGEGDTVVEQPVPSPPSGVWPAEGQCTYIQQDAFNGRAYCTYNFKHCIETWNRMHGVWYKVDMECDEGLITPTA